MSMFRLMFKFIKGNIKYFITSLILIVFLNYMRSLVPLFISKVFAILGQDNGIKLPFYIDNLFDGNSIAVQLTICAAAIVIVAIIRDILNLSLDYFIALSSEGMGYNMQTGFYNHVQDLPYSYLNHCETGDLIQRSIQDVQRCKNFISSQFKMFVTNIAQIVIYSTQMVLINWELSLYVLALLPILLIVTFFYFKYQNPYWDKLEDNEGKLMNVVQENYTGIRVVKAFANEDYEIKKFNKKMDELQESWDKPNHLMSTFWMCSDMVSFSMELLTFILGLVFISHGKMVFSELIGLFLFVQSIMWPMKNLGRLLASFDRTNISARRILEVFDNEDEYVDDHSTLEPEIKGDIVFKDVSFKFEDGNIDTIKDINIHIKPGQTIALVGKTGCGKSTLVCMLNRMLEPTSGDIFIDGVNIKDIKKKYLRKHVGIVLQEPFLFSKTIKENIGITEYDPSLSEIKKAAIVASVDNDIEAFEKGYDTVVGERGVTLSGGQKQRVSIARTILENKTILIFDDSLSAVDTETDVKIRKSLHDVNKLSTTIIITHRVQTAKDADLILVMEDGRIVDSGTHNELISRPGLYQTINSIQSFDAKGGVQ